MTAGVVKHRLYLCLLLFLFVCLDLHLNWQDSVHCSYWIVWITNPEPQVREDCKLRLKAFPPGIHAAVKTVHANSARILHPHKSRGTLQAAIFFHTNLTRRYSFLYIYQSRRPARHFIQCHRSHFLDDIFGLKLVSSSEQRLNLARSRCVFFFYFQNYS